MSFQAGSYDTLSSTSHDDKMDDDELDNDTNSQRNVMKSSGDSDRGVIRERLYQTHQSVQNVSIHDKSTKKTIAGDRRPLVLHIDGIDMSSHESVGESSVDESSRDRHMLGTNNVNKMLDKIVFGNVSCKTLLLAGVIIMLIVSSSVITYVLTMKSFAEEYLYDDYYKLYGIQDIHKASVRKIAFGSCSSYDLRDMSIFTTAIIPTAIDAWIWAGDMVYLDTNEVNCDTFPDVYVTEDNAAYQSSCNCTPSWLESPPHTCHGGDINYAQERWIKALEDDSYNAFLEYMCPAAMSEGLFPPPGYDPRYCERQIYGIYDDHDYGVNNMNRRLPDKGFYKEMYLDAIGESRDSIRRNYDRGAWTKYTLNEYIEG